MHLRVERASLVCTGYMQQFLQTAVREWAMHCWDKLRSWHVADSMQDWVSRYDKHS